MLDPILKVTVLLALVALASHQLRRSSAALRHMLWNFAIIAMVLIPVLTAIVPVRLRILPADAAAIGIVTPRRTAETRTELAASTQSAPTSRRDDSERENAAAEQTADTTSATAAVSAPIDLARLLIIAWVLGAAFLLARYTLGWVR